MGHTTTTTYDADGRKTSVTDNLNHATTYSYDNDGNLLVTTDPLGHTVTNVFDSRGRITSSTDSLSGVTSYTYDGAGNRLTLKDPDNNTTTWTFDAVNRALTDTDQLNHTRSFSYDASGDMTQETDRDGRVRDFTFDNLHRLTAEQWMSGVNVIRTISYTYNAADELLSASDPDSSYAFTYDGDGNVLTADNNGTPGVPHVLLTGVFDSMGDRTGLSATIAGTKDFINSYAYDADQRLSMVQQQSQSGGNAVSPKEVDFAYNGLGQFTSISDFNFIGVGPRTDVATGAYSYDAGNRLTGLAYTWDAGAHAIGAFGWGYDNANNVTSFTSNAGTATYSYDNTNQVTGAIYTGTNQPTNETYSYDSNGNRTNTGYSTGTNNQLTSDGTFTYTYDQEGSRATRTRISSSPANDYTTTYTWDYRDRLTDVDFYNNSGTLTKHVHYVYDVFDHLIAMEADTTGGGSYNVVEHYVLDVSPETPQAAVPGMALAQPVLQFDGNNNLTRRYLEAVDRIFAEGAVSSPSTPDSVTWMLDDNLGSVRYVLDNNSNILDQINYNSFGQVAYESNSAAHHFAGYTGGHLDPNTGLVNDYHRWYDPATGRWTAQDPAGFRPGDPNLNRYVGNSAEKALDPWGLAPDPLQGKIDELEKKIEKLAEKKDGIDDEVDDLEDEEDFWATELSQTQDEFKAIGGYSNIKMQQEEKTKEWKATGFIGFGVGVLNTYTAEEAWYATQLMGYINESAMEEAATKNELLVKEYEQFKVAQEIKEAKKQLEELEKLKKAKETLEQQKSQDN